MKSIFLSIIFIIMTTQISRGQGFNSVHSSNGVEVVAVGNNGLLFRSTDGGLEWTSTTAGTSDLNDVFMLGDDRWVVGDDGVYYYWAGGTTGFQVLARSENLRSVFFLDPLNGWIVGDNGTMLETIDGGVSWTAVTSGTSETLHSIAFTDSDNGYAVGSSGTVLHTDDAGATWAVLGSLGTTNDLYTVGGIGSTIHVGGEQGFHRTSDDGGMVWSGSDLSTDTRSDLRELTVVSSDNVFFLTEGGAIRRSTDGGSTFTYGVHPVLAAMSSIHFTDAQNGWACADGDNVIIRTTDGGDTWSYPPNTVVSRSWSQRLSSFSSIGNTLAVNPLNKDHLYVALGRFVYMSGDRGESWTQTATIATGGSGSTHSFYISPKDTNVWVAAYTGGGDHIRRTTDRGATWTETIEQNFTTWGMPLEMNPDQTDTLLFAADGTGGGGQNGIVYRSLDFGISWDTLAQTTLRSPCDVLIVPGNTSIVYIGDGVTGIGSGQMWRSEDGGKSFTLKYSVTGSEIPGISVSRLRNTDAYATAWSSGGVMRTQNTGENWAQVASTSSAWGTDVAKDDPNVIVYGSYGSGDSFVSSDGGNTFTSIDNSGSNYAYLAYDRATFFAQQSGGVWKLRTTYSMPSTNAGVVTMTSPNGREAWGVGEVHEIRWMAGNVAEINLEYRVDEDREWLPVSSRVTGSSGVYRWTIPNTPTDDARVRITDFESGAQLEISDAPFSITAATVALRPESIDFGEIHLGQSAVELVEITNRGNGPLVVKNVLSEDESFTPGRSSFTIEAGDTDTMSITFQPQSVGEHRSTLVLATNDPSGERGIPLTGTGDALVHVDSEELVPGEYRLDQNYPNPFNPRTEIRYGVPEEGRVLLRIYTMLGEEVATLVDETQQAGWYTVSFGGEDLASGLYIYRMEANDFVSIRKMMLLK